MKKKIGFIDYYISEWHANNYPAWIQDANKALGVDYEVAYVWAEHDISPVNGETTAQWCGRMGATPCATLAELCEKSDVLLILAPSNPEKHLAYAKQALTYGKPTYIDKTFAPDYSTAAEIFRIARDHHTPFFSSSALRYAEELAELTDAQNIILTGGGSNLNEYIIHLVEMAVTLLQDPADAVQVMHLGNQRLCSVETRNHKKAVLLYSPALPFAATAENSQGIASHYKITSPFFAHLLEDILRFYESEKTSFDVQETLEVMRIRDGILKADTQPGTSITLNEI